MIAAAVAAALPFGDDLLAIAGGGVHMLDPATLAVTRSVRTRAPSFSSSAISED